MTSPPHIAFVIDELPFAELAGHQRVNMALLRFLCAQGYRTTVVVTGTRLPNTVTVNHHANISVVGPEIKSIGRFVAPVRLRAVLKLAAKQVVEASPRALQYFVQWLRSGGAPTRREVLGRFPSESQIEWIARWAAEARPTAMLFDTIFRCPVIPRLAAPRPKIAVLTPDVVYLRHASLAGRGISIEPPSLSREEESKLLQPADILVAITPQDRAILSEMSPHAVVIEASIPCVCSPRPVTLRRNPRQVLFVGSSSIHNVDGLRWLLDEVWPLVRAAIPDAHLVVCGLVSRGVPFAPAGVTLMGRVDNLTSHYHNAGHAICPLRAGSGLKIKMLEYFAHGLPCVTTSIGQSGFAHSVQPPFVVADTPADFANAMVKFMTAPQLLSDFEARAYAYCTHYDAARMFGPLIEHLHLTPTGV